MANSILQAFALEQHQKQLQYQQQQQMQHQQQLQDEESDFGAQQRKRKTSCRTGIALSTEQKMRLIDHIHDRPQIWDSTTEGFRSNQARQAAFNDVATQLSDATETFSRIQIQEEWGKLRYCFTRIMKKLLEEANGQLDDSQLATISWPYWKRMEYLMPGVKAQLSHQAVSTESEHDDIHHQQGLDNSPSKDSIASTTAMSTKVRKKRGVRKSSADYAPQTSPTNSDVAAGHGTGMAIPPAMSTQEMLMANFASLNSSQNLIDQLQQHNNNNALLNKNATMQSHCQKSLDGGGDYSTAFEVNKNNELSSVLGMGNIARGGGNSGGSMSTADLVAALGGIKTTAMTTQNIADDSLINLQNKYRKVSSDLEALFHPSSFKKGEEATGTRSAPFEAVTNGFMAAIDHQQPTTAAASNEFDAGWGQLEGIRRDNSSEPDADSSGDIAESFGRCIVQQLQAVAKKSAVLGVQMRRELMDVCFKYEMRACAAAENGHG